MVREACRPAAVGGLLVVSSRRYPFFEVEMTRLAQFLIRHGILFDHPAYRRFIHRAVYRPIGARDYGSGIEGMYDLGQVSPAVAKRFQRWDMHGGSGG